VIAPDLTLANVSEVVETRPQVDALVEANAPSQLIREIAARVSYPRASKSSSGANPRVAQKRSTPDRARQGAAQGKGAATKKAPQGGVSSKGNIRATMSKYDRNGSGRFEIEPTYYNLLVSAGVTVCIQH